MKKNQKLDYCVICDPEKKNKVVMLKSRITCSKTCSIINSYKKKHYDSCEYIMEKAEYWKERRLNLISC